MVDAEYSPHWKCGKCGKAYEDMFQAEDCCEEPKKEEVKVEQEPINQIEIEQEIKEDEPSQ
jgi:hypothetical protein